MMLLLVAGLSLSSPIAVANRRQLSAPLVGKYATHTNVQDHANIENDQCALEAAFGSSPYAFAAVKAAWEGAGHSKVTATCTLAANAAVAVAVGDKIAYTGADGNPHIGTATAATATTETAVAFKTAVVQDNKNSRIDSTAALLTSPGGVTIGTCTPTTVAYASGRTLKGFSTSAKAKMYVAGASCPAPRTTVTYKNGCPYVTYVPYYNYYCASATSSCHADGDYVNQAFVAGTDALAVAFDHFSLDFQPGTTGNQEALRKDFTKKISKFAGTWMYAMREYEDAIDDCVAQDYTNNAWSDGAVHAWDEGVAFYHGMGIKTTDYYDAVTGEEKAPPTTCSVYTLANKRCQNFKTCGRNGDKSQGEAYVNYELWKLSADGRDQILSGNCAGAVPVKDEMYRMMTVPLIQGTLRYSHKCSNGKTCTAKAIGEYTAFAFAVLPQVAAADAAAAAIIATGANPASYTCASSASCSGTKNDFAAVKAAFEKTYPAMGITCKLVGGLWDSNSLKYEAGAEPCSDVSNTPPPTYFMPGGGLDTGAIVGIAIGASFGGLLLLCLLYVLCKERAGTPLFTPVAHGSGGSSTASASKGSAAP